jgi:sugar lactone lactonase YvrE
LVVFIGEEQLRPAVSSAVSKHSMFYSPMNSIILDAFQKLRLVLASGLLSLAAVSALAQPAGSSFVFTHLAGPLGGLGSTDGLGSAARFNTPDGVAVDRTGNVYVVDSANNTIRKITPGGLVTTFAGTPGAKGSADGIGAAARFNDPHGIAVDIAGFIYVADSGNSTIRKISPGGVVTTLAGTPGGQGSADGLGAAGWFWYPRAVAVDNAGTLYVADNSTIRKVTSTGLVSTLAGKPGPWGSADGTGPDAQFAYPSGIAVDGTGIVYIADTGNNRIRRITPDGVVTTLKDSYANTLAIFFYNPVGITVDGSGNLLIAVQYSNIILKLTPDGVSTIVAGSSTWPYSSVDGTGTDARFYYPRGLALDATGVLYVADSNNYTIRKITPLGVVTTLAGLAGGSGNKDATGADARFYEPGGVAVDSTGNVYVADTNNQAIRKITPAGVVTTLAGSNIITYPGGADGIGADARFYYPNGVAADKADNLYVADTYDNAIRQISQSGFVNTLAGTLSWFNWGSTDGTGSAARFRFPDRVAVDGAGYLYVADSGNNTVRKISPGGVVTTLAGTAGISGSADGTGGNAQFSDPSGVAVDNAGNVYVTDTNTSIIRKITRAGAVTTLAGMPGVTGADDGTGTAARFNHPQDVAVDGTGNLYVADSGNNTIRMITPAGVVTTIGGTPGVVGCEDGIGAAARFNYPIGVAFDSAGNLYVVDSNNNAVRKAQLATVPVITAQPVGQTVTPGSNVQFTVSATSILPLTYQWFVNGVSFNGATTNTFSFANARTTDAGDYTVVITNALGSVTSNKAGLTVSAASTPTPPPAESSGSGGGSIGAWFVFALVGLGAVRHLAKRPIRS